MLDTRTLAMLVLSFGSMSNKKLQKICYYVYSWYLVKYNKRIAPTHFEAWVHGPVSREIYNEYKQYGWDLIPQYNGFLPIDEEIIAFARTIWNQYGRYTADELEKMSHEELPWIKARQGLREYEPSNKILDDQDIKAYFSKQRNIL